MLFSSTQSKPILPSHYCYSQPYGEEWENVCSEIWESNIFRQKEQYWVCFKLRETISFFIFFLFYSFLFRLFPFYSLNFYFFPSFFCILYFFWFISFILLRFLFHFLFTFCLFSLLPLIFAIILFLFLPLLLNLLTIDFIQFWEKSLPAFLLSISRVNVQFQASVQINDFLSWQTRFYLFFCVCWYLWRIK